MTGNKQWWFFILALVSAACHAKTAEATDRTEITDRSAALRRSLLIHDMYHDMSMSMSLSMSMEHNKGKGKKSKKSKSSASKSKSPKGKGKGAIEAPNGKGKGAVEAPKGKGKGAVEAPKGKGKGVPPGPKSSKKGKGKGNGETLTPEEGTPSPSTTVEPMKPSQPSEPLEPSAPSPSVPTATPPTPPTAGDIGIVLEPYDILYSIEQTRIPNQADYRGVTELTQAYLDAFFAGVLDLSTDIMFSSSSTTNTDRTFRLGQPVTVEYNTTIFLSSLSSVVPGEEELNALLVSAFQQQNAEYLEAVQGLSRVNIFSTTTTAEFVESTRTDDVDNDQVDDGSENSESESSSSPPIGMISAAAAGAMVLFATGYFAYRRSISEDEPAGKFFDQDGHVTVAGDTYTGDTYAGADSHSGTENVSHSYLPHNWHANSEYMEETGFQSPGSPDAAFEDIPVDVDDYSESCDSYDYEKP